MHGVTYQHRHHHFGTTHQSYRSLKLYSLHPTLKFTWHSLNFLELVCSATSSMHFTSTKLCKNPKAYFFSRHIITLFTFSINETKKLMKLTSIKPHLASNTLSPNKTVSLTMHYV